MGCKLRLASPAGYIELALTPDVAERWVGRTRFETAFARTELIRQPCRRQIRIRYCPRVAVTSIHGRPTS